MVVNRLAAPGPSCDEPAAKGRLCRDKGLSTQAIFEMVRSGRRRTQPAIRDEKDDMIHGLTPSSRTHAASPISARLRIEEGMPLV
jgi:hypothetical protein